MGIVRQVERVRGSYAAKLAIALAVVVVLTVGVGAMVYQQANSQLQQDVQDDLTATADARAAQVSAWVDNVRGQTALASDRQVLTEGSDAEVTAYLKHLVNSDTAPDGVVAAHYYDAGEKRIVASSSEQLVGVNPGEQGAAFAVNPPQFDGPGDVALTEPFTVPVVDFPVIAVLSPVENTEDKRLVFMVNVNAVTDDFARSVSGSQSFVVNEQGTYVAHPDQSRVMSTYAGDSGLLERSLSEQTYTEVDGSVVAAAPVEGAPWTVMVQAPTSQAFALGDLVLSSIVGLILLTLVSLALIGVTLGSTTVVSLRQFAARADEMAAGNLDTTIETGRNDEFGTLANSFRQMRDSLSSSLADAEAAKSEAESARAEAEQQREEAERAKTEAQETARQLADAATDYEQTLTAVANGDLTQRVDADRDHDQMARVGESINAMLDDIETSVAAASSFADHVSDAALRVDDGATDAMDASANVSGAVDEISDGATEQTERLHDVAGEVDDLSASAEEVAETVASLANTAGQAADAVEDGREATDDAVTTMEDVAAEAETAADAMDDLDDEMDDIGEIVDVIADIAEQTNMLALNASIEAARTGADGDGFAVVADEVKGLAEESRDAAEDIEDRLLDLQGQVSEVADEMRETSQHVADGRETVGDAANALDDVVQFVAETDSAASEIEDATDRQAEAASRVASAVDEVASISEETAAQSTDVADAADEQTETLSEVGDAAADLAERAATLDELLADFDARGGEEVN